MKTEHLVSIQQFCTHHNVELSFIESLHEIGLIEIMTIEQTHFFDKEKLNELEKMVRLHYDLEINIEGIDAIYHLLNKVKSLQEELNMLKNKFDRYE